MARNVFFSFRHNDRAINVTVRPLADQQTAVIRALIELQGM